MRIDSRIPVVTTLAALALSVSCGDDSTNPAGEPVEEIVLATFTSGGSSSGPTQPPQPYGIVIEIGVDDEVLDPYAETVDPLVLGNKTFGDDTDVIARPWDTQGLGVMASRLTDGLDTSGSVSVHTIGGGTSYNSGLESMLFDYEPGLSRNGPDLEGYTVTGLRVQVDLEVTDSGGWWTIAHACTLSILGH